MAYRKLYRMRQLLNAEPEQLPDESPAKDLMDSMDKLNYHLDKKNWADKIRQIEEIPETCFLNSDTWLKRDEVLKILKS